MTSVVIGLDPSRTGTDPDVAVNTVASTGGYKTYLYVKASAAIAAGDVVTVDTTGNTTVAPLGTANDARGNRVGVATVAIASGSYGWVQIYGAHAAINVLASAAANVRLNTTATAGSLDDDATAGSMQVQGVYLTTARGGTNGPAPGMILNPYVDVTL